MSMLMVSSANYKDLSWQDHTVQTEVMLFPIRNNLLMNKHKTLNTKCRNEKFLYEKEKDAVLKNITIEKRIMVRKKDAYTRRRSEIKLQRAQSADTALQPKVSKTIPKNNDTKRGLSAPAKIGWAEKDSDCKRGSLFMTEVHPPASAEPRLRNTESRTGNFGIQSPFSEIRPPTASEDNFSTATGPASNVRQSSRRIISPTSSKPSTRRAKSVRFKAGYSKSAHDEFNDENDNERPLSLDERVKLFNQNQTDFNTRPNSYTSNRSYSFRTETRSKPTKDPIVAKRYNSMHLDTNSLETAFNSFCLDRSKGEFEKLVRMASKMRASVNVARNQSIVPTMATFKGTRAFKNLLNKPDSPVSV